MSRIGNLPVSLPKGVTAALDSNTIVISGPLGTLEQALDPRIRAVVDEEKKQVQLERRDDERQTKALHGLSRNLIANMTVGVSQGYVKGLQIVGVGYSAKVQGEDLVVEVGFSHAVRIAIPDDVTVDPPESSRMHVSGVGEVPCTTVRIRGIDKQRVGQFAARVRHIRPPEPYKAKGIRYEGEEIRRKAGKVFAAQE
jgi:large subunit ribosomal protein L6